MGNVVMKASRSEAAREAVRADESNAAGATWRGADAEAPQAFKEGASTMRNAQNRIHIGCSAAAWGVKGWG